MATNASTEIKRTETAQIASLATTKGLKGESNTQRSLRKLMRHRMALVGVGLLVFVVLYVLIGSFVFTEAQANYNDPAQALQFPTSVHPMGTDEIGRDLLARTIYGGQISLFIAVVAVAVEILIGTLVGLISGYFGGIPDAVLMRITEMMLSIPQLFVTAIIVRVLTDPQRLKVMGMSSSFSFMGREFSITMVLLIFIIGFTSWMRVARIVRATVLSLKEQDFITAATSIGAPRSRIVLRHILPNCMGPVIVSATLGVANAILLEAYLSFLGYGVRAPTATWGSIMQEAGAHPQQWFYWLFPASLIMLTVLGINFFGDGIRDAFDPRSKAA